MTETPVWLLDIDGVINAYAYRQETPGAWPTYDFQMVDGFPIWMSPDIVAFIIRMHESGLVDIRWCTTWCDKANELMSPAFGLPEFPVGGRPYYPSDRSWKGHAALEVVSKEKRDLIWTDDDAITREVRWHLERDDIDQEMLLIAPKPTVGLTLEDCQTIEAFLSNKKS